MKITTVKNYSKVANYIEKSKRVQRVLYYADKNPSIFQATGVFVLASFLRPTAMLSMPAKTEDGKKDLLYSASRSIVTGAVDLTTALAIFYPLNKSIDKVGRILFNTKNSAYFQNKEACSAFKSIFNRGTKIAILPIVAYLNFAYVKQLSSKITKHIFREGDKK